MKKKLIIALLLFGTLLFCGCEMNNLNNTKTPSKLTVSDIKQLIGVSYSDIEKIYGSPKKSTYYINTNDLSSINSNHVSLRDFNHHSIIKAYYNINNDDSYIILWYKNNKVIKSYFYENDYIDKDYFDVSSNKVNIQIDYNKNNSKLNYDLSKKIYKNYIDNNINEFSNKYKLTCPLIAVNLLNKNKVLYFYDIKNIDVENMTTSSLFIICNDNIITNINIIKHSSICESIIEYIK